MVPIVNRKRGSISRILYFIEVSIIYLALLSQTGSICLPLPEGTTWLRAATCQMAPKYTWHFNLQGLSIPIVTNRHCELLPHIFTLTPIADRGGNFLRHSLYSPKGSHLLDGAAPYVVRTFLGLQLTRDGSIPAQRYVFILVTGYCFVVKPNWYLTINDC